MTRARPHKTLDNPTESKASALSWLQARAGLDDAAFRRRVMNGPLMQAMGDPQAPDTAAVAKDMHEHLEKLQRLIAKMRRTAKKFPHATWGAPMERVPIETMRVALARYVVTPEGPATNLSVSSTLAAICAQVESTSDARALYAILALGGIQVPPHLAPMLQGLSALLDAADKIAEAWPPPAQRGRGPTAAQDKNTREYRVIEKWAAQFTRGRPTDREMAVAAVAFGAEAPGDVVTITESWKKKRQRRRR